MAKPKEVNKPIPKRKGRINSVNKYLSNSEKPGI
jgi:hypothetical protein